MPLQNQTDVRQERWKVSGAVEIESDEEISRRVYLLKESDIKMPFIKRGSSAPNNARLFQKSLGGGVRKNLSSKFAKMRKAELTK